MIIRKMRRSETSTASRLAGINFSQNYRRRCKREVDAMFLNYESKPIYFVAEEGEKMAGFAGYVQSWMDYEFYEIFWVNVLQEHRERGIGTALVKKIISEIKTDRGARFVLLTTHNPEFYRKIGFHTLFGYGDKGDCAMILSLKRR